MFPPVRAHLISLSLVLGLTVSLVWGQSPIHFTLSGDTVTGPLPITSVGRGAGGSPSLLCHTTNAANAVWLYPDGTEITRRTFDIPAINTFIYVYVVSAPTNFLRLRRGPNVVSPGGDYCCGSTTNTNERLCINLVMDCGTPPSIPNGSPGTPTSTSFEGTVNYTCNNGYQISPGVTMSTVSCLDTGNWETVTCLVVCGTPPSISNGSPETPTSTLLGGTVTYTCNNGYQISPGVTIATAYCMASGNWETIPTCLVLCPILSVLDNGTITYSPTNFSTSVGTMATYQCNVGYILIGVATRTCGSNGVWSGEASTCEAVDCGTPPSISNGSPGTPTKTIFEGSVTYTCNNGYQISPGVTMATASCIAIGNWENIPICPAVDCGPPPSTSNGSHGTPSKTTFEGTVTYTCNNGYQISPGVTMAIVSCLATGNWENVTCLAMCLDLQPLMNGAITYQPAGPVQLQGTTATHSCTSGYRLSRGPVRVCQSDMTWSGDTITCLAICPALQAITNGNISYSLADRLEGGTAVYSCTDDFLLSSGSTRTCEDSGTSGGVWNGIEPSCLAVIVVPSADDPPTAGQSYSLTCTVTGADSLNPTISYLWTRESTTVGTNSATLMLDPLVLSDTGQYRCEVTLSSNLFSENFRAVSDMFDLVIPTVFIELLFRGIHNCPEYRQNNANGVIQDVTNGLVEAIQDVCGCGLTSNHVSKSFLQCFSDSPEQIAFRAQLNQTTQATTEELVSYIDQWVRNPGHLSVQGSLLQQNSTCSLVITDQFVSSECPTTRATETLPSSAPTSSHSDNTGAIVGAVVLILGLAVILAVTAVIIAYLVLKQRRMGGVDLRIPDIPLTDRGFSSTVPIYDTVDVTYERIGVPHPMKGSCEYFHCEAYGTSPEEGVISVVEPTGHQ